MKTIAVVTTFVFLVTSTALAQEGGSSAETGVVSETPTEPASSAPADCRKVNMGGPIAGIVVGAIFWPLLPMSIPVLVTQSKKLKRRNREIYEQAQRGCPPQR